MSKANKQQRSIDSFFKNPAPTKAKPVKQEEPEPVAAPMEEERPPPQPPSKAKPAPPSPKKPTVIAPSPPPAPVRTATHDTEWINLSERFLLNNRNFDVQYAHLYAERLGSMRKIVSQAAENRWGTTTVPIKKMNDLILDEECILIGILFKQMVLKPSIVKQLAAENGFNLQPPRKRYVDATDQLILEEESQRIVLNGNLDINHFVTGVVIAVLGHEDDKGMFIVKEYCFKEMSIPKPLNSSCEDKYVLFASGFLLSETSVIFNQLEYLTKSLTKPEEIQSKKLRDVFQNLVRVVVAGNLIENSNRLKESTNQAKYLTRKLAANSVEAMHSIDELFDKISAITDIDVMPGVNDPSCHMLPQQPLHPCMFPSASKRKTTHCLTNPYDFQIGELRFLGTSGQNIDDIDLQSTFDNRLDILEHILRWGVIAPTCPDTLSCYPYVKNDPFIIHHTPNLFFAGNQPKYETRLFQDSNGIEVRLLAIPQFAQSSSCVAVNLRNFECLEISFEKETIEICAP